MKSSKSDSLQDRDARFFGLEVSDESWFEHLRAALAPEPLGAIGSYEIEREVARGGQGIVYRAVQPGTNRPIALKRMLGGSFATNKSRQRFERETELASRLRHPGIVTVYGVENTDGSPSLAMEWVDGVPITTWARDVQDREDLLRAFLLVCDAVQHAHQHGVVHRDLKPSNVVVDAGGFPRILDFGLAKLVDDECLTLTGGFVGTPAYASSEQLEGAGAPVDTRSDVFSLGVMFYEMLTGERPYRPEDGIRDYLAALDREAAAPPSTIVIELDGELDAIALKALARLPEDRYQSASALADDLRRYISGDAVLAHPPSHWYQFKKLVARQRLAFVLLVMLITSLVVGLLVAVHQRNVQIDARANADVQRLRADRARQNADDVLSFLLDEVLHEASPSRSGEYLSVEVVAELAAARVGKRFQGRPEVEVDVRRRLADLFREFSRFVEAEREIELALQKLKSLPQELPALRGRTEWTAGYLRAAQGRSEDAIAHMRAALDLLPPDSHASWRLRAHESIAVSYVGLEDSDRAEEHFRAAIAILEAIEMEETDKFLKMRGLLVGLAMCKARRGDYAGARPEYERALALAIKAVGESSEPAANTLALLADLDEVEGKLDDAKARSRGSLEVFLRIYGRDHLKTIAAMGDLGAMLVEPDEIAEGVRLLRHAVAVSREKRAAGSIITTIHECRLGRLLCIAGRGEEAELLLRRAYDLFSAEQGPAARWTGSARQVLSDLYFDNAQWSAAAPLLTELVEHSPREDLRQRGRARAVRCFLELERPADAAVMLDALVDHAVRLHDQRADRAWLRESIQWMQARGHQELVARAGARESAADG